MHILVTGGGTGGHAFPAVEIAKAFLKENKDVKVTLVGNLNSIEEKLSKLENISFLALKSKPLTGKSITQKIYSIFNLFLSIIIAIFFILKINPKAIIGVGGYVSAPMIIAGFLLRKKIFLCEQNVSPGVANRWLSYLAKIVFINFIDSKKYFKHTKTIVSGNPVRTEFFKNSYTLTDGFNILITGGSGGSNFINKHIPNIVNNIKNYPISVTHQTGTKDFLEVKNLYEKYKINAKVIPFISNMPDEFLKHDLIISRAGATVISEICAFGMPSILIPYPHANAHQKENALVIVKNHAGFMIEENSSFEEKMTNILKKLIENKKELLNLSKNAKNLACIDASKIIYQHITDEIK